MKLIKGKNANRGFTLVELIVVMGLSIIVLALMLSMLTIFTNKVSQNKAYQGFYDEVAMCRDEIQEFIANAEAANTSITVINSDKESTLQYATGKKFHLYGHVLNSSTLTKDFYFDYINKIEYEILDEDPGAGVSGHILRCTIYGTYVAGKEDVKDANGKLIGKNDIIKEMSQVMLFSIELNSFKNTP